MLPTQGARGLIPGQGTRSHMLRLKDNLHTTVKVEDPMCCSQDLAQPNKSKERELRTWTQTHKGGPYQDVGRRTLAAWGPGHCLSGRFHPPFPMLIFPECLPCARCPCGAGRWPETHCSSWGFTVIEVAVEGLRQAMLGGKMKQMTGGRVMSSRIPLLSSKGSGRAGGGSE